VQIPAVEIVVNNHKQKREADLDRHLSNETQTAKELPGSEVSAADDYMMYQALILLKGADVLSGKG
jgi:hypothetical protein